MNRWLLEGTATDSPPAAHSRQSRRARSCGKASCASGCIMLAVAIVVTGCAIFSLMVSIGTTARSEEMVVVECNITAGHVVAARSTTCTGSGLQRALAPWARRFRVPANARFCYAPQWNVLVGTAEDAHHKRMRSAVATGSYYLRAADAEAALQSKIDEARGELLPCQYDEATPTEAFFSTSLLEQAAGDAMMLAGLLGLCGLVLSLLAAAALRVGIRTMRQSEAVHRWQINAAMSDAEPPSPVAGVAGMDVEPAPEIQPESEPHAR